MMYTNTLRDWAEVLIEQESDQRLPQLWRWVARQVWPMLDALVDIIEGRWPFGRHKDAVAEDEAMVLLRSKGWLVLPPETKARVEIRFLDELMPASMSNAA